MRGRLSESLLNNAFQKTKEEVTKVLEASLLLNIVCNKNDNIKGKRILNMTVLTKKHNAFYAFSKLIKDQLTFRYNGKYTVDVNKNDCFYK